METDLFTRRIRLRHLDCFACVAETGHLGRAASRLQLTQPAVSKTLSELEDIVGMRLLERGRAGTALTREGRDFLPRARAVLDALGAARAAVRGGQDARPTPLRIGALPTVAPDLLPAALERFRAARPHTPVEVQAGTNTVLLAMLKAGDIDLALARMADPESMRGLSFELLYVEPMTLVVRRGHPLAGKPVPGLQEVAGFPVVVSAQGTIPRHNTESFFRSHGLELPLSRVETLSVSLARQLVRKSDAVWFAPAGAARPDVEDGLLTTLQLAMPGLEEPVGLMTRSDSDAASPGPAARDFAGMLRACAAAAPRPQKRRG
ncbi:MAG TPA: pca operon transcription factor PcaQ [Noviherbaspirillum sp.]|jgi:pca operon transcription factor PcaQ|uniref:pca operon transcription factor PcaQ n=1 Tax=Noviherbaspirillum sp. TaxID=1926288 RepID=UPI002F953B0D